MPFVIQNHALSKIEADNALALSSHRRDRGLPVSDTGIDITVEYCPECGYYPRVGWLLGEIMADIQHDVKRVTIIPSGNGRHEWKVDGELVFSKAAEGRHPDVDELKALIYAKLA